MNEDIKITLDTPEELNVELSEGSIQYGKLQVGETTTGEAGTKAIVTNSGSSSNAILNFTIPKGDTGKAFEYEDFTEEQLADLKGEKGDSNTLTIGTVEKGEEAAATITGESPNQVLNLVLPKGDKGDNPKAIDEQTGSSLTIEASEYNAKEFKIDGKSEQDGEPTPDAPVEIKTIPSIRNLFDKDNLQGNFFYNSDTSLPNSTNLEWNCSQFIKVNSNTQYIVSLNKLGENSSNGQIIEWSIDKKIIYHIWNNLENRKFTTKSDTAYVTIAYKNIFYDNVQLEEGSIAHDYVPYGSWAKVKITGKNIFDKNNINLLNCYIQANGTLSDTASDWLGTSSYIKVKPNTEYVASAKNLGTRFIYAEYSSNNATTVIGQRIEITPKTSFKTSATTNFIRFCTNNPDATDFQLEEKIATEYEEYKEKEVLIDLQDNELCSIGDIKDTLEIKDGKVVINKKIGKVVLDGSEGWIKSGSSNNNYFVGVLSGKTCTDIISTKKSIAMSSHFINTGSYVGQSECYSFYNPNASGIYAAFGLSININKVATLEDFKTWLSENPVTVYYILAEPQQITLDTTDIPLYEGINNISLVEDLETDLYVKYYTSFKGAKGEAGKDGTNDYNLLDNKPIISLDSLPTPSEEYTENIYKLGNDLYKVVEKKAYNNINVGDNLSGATLKFDFSGDYSTTTDTSGTVITTIIQADGGTRGRDSIFLYENYVEIPDKTVLINADINDTDIILYQNINGVVTKLDSYTLPSDFGVVQSIESSSNVYKSIKVENSYLKWEKLTQVEDSLESNSTTNAPSIHAVNEVSIGTVLYESSVGEAKNITLNDNINNYRAIEIQYGRNGFIKSTGKLYYFNSISLNGFFAYFDDGAQQIIWQTYVEMVNINDTSLIRSETYYTNCLHDSFLNSGSFENGVAIFKVVGYK